MGARRVARHVQYFTWSVQSPCSKVAVDPLPMPNSGLVFTWLIYKLAIVGRSSPLYILGMFMTPK